MGSCCVPIPKVVKTISDGDLNSAWLKWREANASKKPEAEQAARKELLAMRSLIGSSNLDIRSFELNLESSVIAYDARVARALYNRHTTDRLHAKQVHLESWKKRSRGSEFLDSIARLTSALQ